MHGGQEMHTKTLNGRDHLGNLGTGGRITLKCVAQMQPLKDTVLSL